MDTDALDMKIDLALRRDDDQTVYSDGEPLHSRLSDEEVRLLVPYAQALTDDQIAQLHYFVLQIAVYRGHQGLDALRDALVVDMNADPEVLASATEFEDFVDTTYDGVRLTQFGDW